MLATPNTLSDSGALLERELRRLLDGLASGAIDVGVFMRDTAALGQRDSDAIWSLLALLDQYHRLGQIPQPLFRSVKLDIEQLALGARKHAESAQETMDSPQQVEVAPQPVAGPSRQADVTQQLLVSAPKQAEGRQQPRISPIPTHAARPAHPPAREPHATPRSPPLKLAPTADPARPLPAGLVSGRVLRGRYELQTLLGSGGMGTVFKAADRARGDLPSEERHIAIKILHDDMRRRPHMLAALRREFYNAQALSHPNIVRVFDIDQDGEINFFTMELLQGKLLSQLLERIGPRPLLPRSCALAIIRDVGEALVHAHARNIVHGDLKPHNIMLTEHGEVRVLDFGASSALPREPWISELPMGFRAATPTYASCEILEGHYPDPRDDLYALACIAYALLSGDHPYRYRRATEARDLGLQAPRPRGLSLRQWRALKLGLSSSREQRSISVRDWLRRFDVTAAAKRLPSLLQLTAAPPPPQPFIPGWQVAALAVLAGVVGVSLLDRATLDNGVKRVQDVATATLDGAAARLNTLGWFTSKSPLSAAAIPAADAAAAPLGPPPSVEAAAATEPAPSPGHLAFAADSYSVSPDEVMAKVVVRRTDGVSGPVSFAWWIEAGSAVAGSDYAALGKHTEQLVDGQDRMTLYVPLVSDPAQKLTKMFYIVIGNAGGGATLGRLTRAAVFIIPDRFKSS